MKIINKEISNRLIIGVSIIVTLGILTLAWTNRKSSVVELDVVPSDAQIYINDKKTDPGSSKIKPGEYTIKATREGFSDRETTVTIQNNSQHYVGLILDPDQPEYFNWYTENPLDAKKAEGISSRNFDQSGVTINEKYPVIKDLPYYDKFFIIDYGKSVKSPNDSSKIAFYIYATTDMEKQMAKDWLSTKGVSINDSEIIFKETN